jgi:PIN domain nuclease of toxin-antitoxin system
LILLDTSAVLWVWRRHPRARPLLRSQRRIYISPASLLELQILVEAGRLRLRAGGSLRDLAVSDRWLLDDPPSAAWFARALDVGWTRDPFDRLLVGHAALRGWRVATGDAELVDRLGRLGAVEL